LTIITVSGAREYLKYYRASMSHHAFATLWMQLERRKDIDNILSELVGRHSLEGSVLPDDSDGLLNASLSVAVVLRVVFDLQRTYLQSPKPKVSYLLQPRKLLAAIVFLLRTKSKISRLFEDRSEHCLIKRSFIAQTLVSGLRALWLWNHPLPTDEISQLRNAFQKAWVQEELNSRDTFMVHKLCGNIIDGLARLRIPSPNTPSSDIAQPACGQAQLQDYSNLVSTLVPPATIS
jgi:hypothetical protein